MEQIVPNGWAIRATTDGEIRIEEGIFKGLVIKTNSWMRPDVVAIEQPDGSFLEVIVEGPDAGSIVRR